jgi:tricorn protease
MSISTRIAVARQRSLGTLTALAVVALVFAGVAVTSAAPLNGKPTRLLRTPTVSATHIAFAYANNIWMVERAGCMARRLTSFQGQTSNPRFSPDGKWIAFSGEYVGNTDVYVVAAEGGERKRLTWHPGGDLVEGWRGTLRKLYELYRSAL